MFLLNREIFFAFYEVVPQAIFNNAIQTNLFILIRKFADKYKRVPDFDTLLILLDNLPESEKENKKAYVEFIDKIHSISPKIDIDVFSEQLTKTIKDYEIEQFILRSANKVGSITLDDMLGDMRDIMVKFVPKSVGIDVTDVDRSIKFMRQDHSERSSTGIVELDRVLYGGYGADEITILMAPPGKGKSFFLLNAMYYAMLAGKSALYVTLEISERGVVRRLYSRVAYASKKELMEEAMIAQRAKKFFKLAGSQGRVIYYPGNTLTVAGLEALLEQQMLYFGFKPNVLIVDYLDRLAPRKTDYKGDVRHQLRNITDDLRSLSMRHSIPVITATQANRASLSKLKITEANVSESFGKVEVADVILALCQTDEEKQAKRARLVVVKNRDYLSGSTIEFYVDFDHMLLCDLAQANRLGLVGAKLEKPVVERKII
jgi:KaiC/GvpD/RAD55 family RecA-like ATPase